VKVYIFRNSPSENVPCFRSENIESVLQAVASTTDTGSLVTAVYFLALRNDCSGSYILPEVTPAEFSTIESRGDSAFVREFAPPPDLPRSFSLIRMMLGTAYNYPIQQTDTYGWTMRYFTFESHVAFLFGHELHHFRKHRLGLHPRQGEIGANRWALKRAAEEGFPLACRGRRGRP
jgi:hypothetical protein